MSYFLAVFKTRTQTLRFYEILERSSVPCTVVNTPREASVGCGLSVKFDATDYQRVSQIYSLHPSPNFTGFYRVVRSGARSVVTKV